MTRSSSSRRTLTILVLAQVVVGVVIGLIWLGWSPRSVSYEIAGAHGHSIVVPDETEARIAGDGRFVFLSAAAGLAFGLLYWRLRRARGPLVVGVLAGGAVLSSLVARTVGQLLATGATTGPLNTAFKPPLSLHSAAALWVQALLAVLAYTCLAGTAADPQLGTGQPQPAVGTEELAPVEPIPAEDG